MRVQIRGDANEHLSKLETRYAFHWAVEQLLPAGLHRNLVITVVFRSSLKWDGVEEKDNGSFKIYSKEIKGACLRLDEGPRPRNFTVYLNSRFKRPTQLRTLWHETEHIRQWATGQMRDYRYAYADLTRWKDSVYNESLIPYKDQPWEKAAIRAENRLARKYNKHLKKVGLKFGEKNG